MKYYYQMSNFKKNKSLKFTFLSVLLLESSQQNKTKIIGKQVLLFDLKFRIAQKLKALFLFSMRKWYASTKCYVKANVFWFLSSILFLCQFIIFMSNCIYCGWHLISKAYFNFSLIH